MKKLYSLLLLAALSLVCFGASAKNVTFKINNPGSAVILDSSNNYTVIPFEGSEAVLDINGSIVIQPTGNYTIVSVTNQNDVTLNASNIESHMYAEGDVITITTEEKAGRNLTIYGNAEHIYVNDHNYSRLDASNQVDGAWTVKNIPDYSYISIYAIGDYTITAIKDQNDNELLTSQATNYQLYSGNWDGDLTLYVTTANLNELRDKSVTIKVEGNPSDVKVSRNFTGESALSSAETVYKYSDSELPLYFSHAAYSKTLYKVSVAGVDAALEGSYYKITPNDGDVIEIKTDYPDVDVPVKFNFSNADAAGVISDFRVNSIQATDWNTDNFTVKLGSKISMSFNYNDYDINSISVNGENLSSFYSYEFNITDTEGYTIDVNATKKAGYMVTIYCENYDQLTVINGYGYGGEPIIELTGVETTVELSPSKPYVTFKAKGSEYTVSSIDCSGACSVSYQTQVYVSGTGAYIEVAMEKIERNRQAVVYLQPDAPWHPDYTYIKLSPYKETEYTIYLKPGYQVFNFGSFDNTAYVSFTMKDFYSNVVGYQNETPFDSYVYQMDFKDGDVIKAFSATPESYSVVYDIETGAPVKVFHDYITEIENPANHTVFAGTEIHVKPAVAAAEAEGKLVVKVNDAAVAPNEDGIYVATVNADTKIEAYLDANSGVENVDIENGAPVNVYNLQGIEVLRGASANEIQQLPAGVYVAGNKKIVVR